MKQVQRLFSQKRRPEVSSQKYLFAINKKIAPPPQWEILLHAHCYISAAVLVKSGKKVAYTAELLALGGLASIVCT